MGEIVHSDCDGIKQKFEDILRKNGIPDPISEVIVKEFGVGENFGSKIQLVTVKFENPDKAPLNLFTKLMVEDPDSAKVLEDMKFFKKEANFFNDYLPAITEFCQNKGHEELLKMYPKCYHGDEKFMVFENLVLDKGFGMVDKEELQDYDAAGFSFNSIAKHHAISRAFIKHIGGREEFLKRFPNFEISMILTPAGREMFEPAMEKALVRDIDILEKTDVEGKEKAITILKSFVGNSADSIENVLKNTSNDEEIMTLLHGDYWNNNMMFRKDEETGAFVEHALIDFQGCHYGSPSVDFHYFVFQSVQQPVRKENLKDLLKAYHDTFVETSAKLGCPFDVSFDELYLNFRKYIVFGFLLAIGADNGLAFKVLGDIRPEDLKDIGDKLDERILKWIEEHPEEMVNVAKGIIGLVEEYLNLRIE